MKRRLFLLFILLSGAFMMSAHAADRALNLPNIFSDHMVLQCGRPVPVWGQAAPGAEVRVRFAGQEKQTSADPDGKWKLTLDPIAANTAPTTMQVSAGDQTINFKDVLVGEVWLVPANPIWNGQCPRSPPGVRKTRIRRGSRSREPTTICSGFFRWVNASPATTWSPAAGPWPGAPSCRAFPRLHIFTGANCAANLKSLWG